jgi:hypothetical protein
MSLRRRILGCEHGVYRVAGARGYSFPQRIWSKLGRCDWRGGLLLNEFNVEGPLMRLNTAVDGTPMSAV